MTVPPGSPVAVAPTWRVLPARHPAGAAVLASAVYVASLALWLALPSALGEPTAGWVVVLGIDLTRVVVAVVILSVWGLWRPAGFLTAPTWKRVGPALPLLVLPALPAVFGAGLADRPGWKVALGVFGVATVAFGEEGVFRGVVLRVLLARGLRPALFGSAVLFGLMHLVNLANDSPPITVGAQVLMTVGVGIGFGAVVLATGTIWPVIVVHFLMDLANAVQAAAPTEDTRVATADLLANGAVNVALGALAAGYGLWLVRRRVGLIAELEVAPGPAD
ncbi:MAG: CPBP family intramembrane metalloprotease [Actinomycetales bacterium]|nr:CPBP family intramembrane metalloprotease [Actinomycetales bacterium]